MLDAHFLRKLAPCGSIVHVRRKTNYGVFYTVKICG